MSRVACIALPQSQKTSVCAGVFCCPDSRMDGATMQNNMHDMHFYALHVYASHAYSIHQQARRRESRSATDGEKHMRYQYCTDLSDKALGITLFQEFECEVDVSLIWDNNEPALTVNAVYVDGANLSKGVTASQYIVHMIADAVEANDAFLLRVIEDSETSLARAA